MRNTQPETMEEGGCCCQAGDFQEESFEIGKPGAVDPVLGLEVEEEGCPELLINFLPITSSLLLITGREQAEGVCCCQGGGHRGKLGHQPKNSWLYSQNQDENLNFFYFEIYCVFKYIQNIIAEIP